MRIDFYPTRLSDADLEALVALGLHGMDGAPGFWGWLVDLLMNEQVRRLHLARGRREPVEVPRLPMDWQGRTLARALRAATALTYTASSPMIGRFADAILGCINARVEFELEAAA